MNSGSDGGQDDLMGRGNADARSPDRAAKRGLLRLMLKLPTLRGQLQLLHGQSDALSSLCVAYEDASTTLERLLHTPGDSNNPLVEEYLKICREIETEVTQYCLEKKDGVSGDE